MDIRAIPAFYCCYLLRSTIRHQALYVGSTPDPVRRLAQHNGISKGGAVRTSHLSLRPWEMVAMVYGFPSKIAALQFEWAWQNTHVSLRIPNEDRITERETKVVRRSGKTRKKVARPRMSMADKLSNLALLLKVESFVRMPLHIKFFSQDVYKSWQSRSAINKAELPYGFTVEYEPVRANARPQGSSEALSAASRKERLGTGGIEGLDVSYTSYKSVLEKSAGILSNAVKKECSVCSSSIALLSVPTLFCTAPDCSAVSHIQCLSQHFQEHEARKVPFAPQEQEDLYIPKVGSCPECFTTLLWTELIMEYSIRTREPAILRKLLKKPKELKTKGRSPKKANASAPVMDEQSEDDGSVVNMPYEELDEAEINAIDQSFADEDHSHDQDIEADTGLTTGVSQEIEHINLLSPSSTARMQIPSKSSNPEL